VDDPAQCEVNRRLGI